MLYNSWCLTLLKRRHCSLSHHYTSYDQYTWVFDEVEVTLIHAEYSHFPKEGLSLDEATTTKTEWVTSSSMRRTLGEVRHLGGEETQVWMMQRQNLTLTVTPRTQQSNRPYYYCCNSAHLHLLLGFVAAKVGTVHNHPYANHRTLLDTSS